MSELPALRLAGTPRAIGAAHGRAASDRVAWNLEAYFRRFEREAHLPRREVLRRTARYWAAVRRDCAEFAAMVEGIAEGAGQPLDDVAALNLRYELLYSEFARLAQATGGGQPASAGECTAFAVLPAAAPDGHLRLGQNWDWFPEVAGLLVHVTRPDGLRVLGFTEAGIAGGKIGLNSAGVGMVFNGLLSTADDWARLGRPFHARTWEALCSPHLDGAVRAIAGGDWSCSASFIIGQSGPEGTGAAVSIEAAPGATSAETLDGAIHVHANHFLRAGHLGIRPALDEEQRSTLHRGARMERLLHEAVAAGPVTPEALTQFLRDHDQHPDSICRHASPALPEGERYQTIVSVLMDLHAGRLRAAAGVPCRAVYEEHHV